MPRRRLRSCRSASCSSGKRRRPAARGTGRPARPVARGRHPAACRRGVSVRGSRGGAPPDRRAPQHRQGRPRSLTIFGNADRPSRPRPTGRHTATAADDDAGSSAAPRPGSTATSARSRCSGAGPPERHTALRSRQVRTRYCEMIEEVIIASPGPSALLNAGSATPTPVRRRSPRPARGPLVPRRADSPRRPDCPRGESHPSAHAGSRLAPPLPRDPTGFSTRARMERNIRGRPRRRGRDLAAWRPASRSPCQRRIVSGRTSSRRRDLLISRRTRARFYCTVTGSPPVTAGARDAVTGSACPRRLNSSAARTAPNAKIPAPHPYTTA